MYPLRRHTSARVDHRGRNEVSSAAVRSLWRPHRSCDHPKSATTAIRSGKGWTSTNTGLWKPQMGQILSETLFGQSIVPRSIQALRFLGESLARNKRPLRGSTSLPIRASEAFSRTQTVRRIR
jgi:hypothetical protein